MVTHPRNLPPTKELAMDRTRAAVDPIASNDTVEVIGMDGPNKAGTSEVLVLLLLEKMLPPVNTRQAVERVEVVDRNSFLYLLLFFVVQIRRKNQNNEKKKNLPRSRNV